LTSRNTVVIYNPFAGAFKHRQRKHWLDESVEVLRSLGDQVDVRPTTGAGTAKEIARQALEDGADLILAAGGDGTVNEVMNGMVFSKVPMGILPAGTANVLAMELGMGTRMVQITRNLANYIPESIAVGELRTQQQQEQQPPGDRRYFMLMAGIGLDADIVYKLDPNMKNSLGKIAYWLAGFSHLGRRLPEFTVVANGQNYRASFALASRVRNYGGDLEIARTISLLDDELELVLFSGESTFSYLKYMLGVALGRLNGMRGVTIVRTTALSCSSPPDSRVNIQVDGEFAGRLPFQIDLVPHALTLLVPPDFRTRRPLSVPEAAWTTSPTR
jgi:YegS/Rv2252/BmrU family lipid kinase